MEPKAIEISLLLLLHIGQYYCVLEPRSDYESAVVRFHVCNTAYQFALLREW